MLHSLSTYVTHARCALEVLCIRSQLGIEKHSVFISMYGKTNGIHFPEVWENEKCCDVNTSESQTL